MLKYFLYPLIFISVTGAGLCFARQPPGPQLNPAELEELLRRARLGVSEYKSRFKDLTADEEQKVEEYGPDGKVRRQRRVVSDLIIYQSQLDASVAAEYRNVREVDGAAVRKREERVVNLFKRLGRADSVKKELDRITRESQRYDDKYRMNGATLNQGLMLDEKLRSVMQFTDAGRERVSGRDVIVLQYRQVAQTPEIQNNLSMPSALKGAEPLYRGRLWLDAETAQIWREEQELTLQHGSWNRVLVLWKFEFEYAASGFGILTPRRIVWSSFDRGRMGADKFPEMSLSGRVTFEYSSFRRFDVGAPEASVEPPVKP